MSYTPKQAREAEAGENKKRKADPHARGSTVVLAQAQGLEGGRRPHAFQPQRSHDIRHPSGHTGASSGARKRLPHILIIHTSRCLAGLRDAQWSTGAARLRARCDCACPCACVKHPAQRTKSSVRVGMVGVRRVAAGSAAHLTVRGIQLTPILELIIRGVSCAARVWRSPWLCTACGWSSCGPLPRRGYGVPGLFGRLAFSAGRRLGRLRRHCRRARCIGGNSGG